MIGKRWAFAYMGLDIALYLAIKVMRSDFYYWIPASPLLEVLISVFLRVVVKIIADFTSIVHFRHPVEVGGAHWTFSLLLSMAGLPIAIKIFEESGGEKDRERGNDLIN